MIKSNSDFPQIIINSIPAPELIYENVTDEDLKPYIEGLKELDEFGVDFIVMVCNTIHLFYERLQREINTPILDLRKELKRVLIERGIKCMTVLGTPLTVKKGLYEFRGIKSINPGSEELEKLSLAIFNFNRGIEREKQIQTVKEICRKYLNLGSEVIILGCTEFAVMLGDAELPVINTVDVLAEMVIRKYCSLKGGGQSQPRYRPNTALRSGKQWHTLRSRHRAANKFYRFSHHAAEFLKRFALRDLQFPPRFLSRYKDRPPSPFWFCSVCSPALLFSLPIRGTARAVSFRNRCAAIPFCFPRQRNPSTSPPLSLIHI